MSEERLQKALAHAGVGSRRQVEDMIREGRVTVNGQLAELGQKADLAVDAVKVDGKRVGPGSPHRTYVLVNKPRNVVSTRADPEGRPTVLELVPQRLQAHLKPVGRLDFDSEGLLLLTDDGELAQRVAHPRYGCIKTYEVKVKGRPDDADVERLRRGIRLDGKRTAPAAIDPMARPSGQRDAQSNSWWQVQLGEGRTRQIREMFFRIGHPVQKLRRVAIGAVRDAALPPGGWRELTDAEVESLRRGDGPPGKPRPPRRATRPSGPRGAGSGGTGSRGTGSRGTGSRGTGSRGTGSRGTGSGGRRSGPEDGGRPGGGRPGGGRPGGGRTGGGRPGDGRPGGGRQGGGRSGGGRGGSRGGRR